MDKNFPFLYGHGEIFRRCQSSLQESFKCTGNIKDEEKSLSDQLFQDCLQILSFENANNFFRKEGRINFRLYPNFQLQLSFVPP